MSHESGCEAGWKVTAAGQAVQAGGCWGTELKIFSIQWGMNQNSETYKPRMDN